MGQSRTAILFVFWVSMAAALDPVVLAETKGTPKVHGKTEIVN
jgi:hypothetical protein